MESEPVDTSSQGGYHLHMSTLHIHQTQPDVVNRLKRADGHLRTIIAMIEEQRSCVEVAQQLHAVEKAVAAAKKILIHDHIDHCLEHVASSSEPDPRASIAGFKEITKYL